MKKIYFRADASPEIGYGHFIRCLALAGMLKDDFECVFFTQTPSEYQRQEVAKICRLVELPAGKEKFNVFLESLSGEEIVVLDNYFFSTEYQRKIKVKGCGLVCIDDMHDKHYVADVVINHGIDNPELFDVEPYTRLCIGLDWALLRKPFLELSGMEKNKGNMFLCFGGSDFKRLTEKYLPTLASVKEINKISVVVGDGYILEDKMSESKKIDVYKNLSDIEMVSLMQDSEYALLPTSGVCMEALACGCKVLGGYYVDNQREFYNYLKSKGIIYPLGNLTKVSNRIVDTFLDASQFKPSGKLDTTNIKKRYISVFKQI